MKVAYVVNQYPRTSHAFVRREIEALEALGIAVARYAIRPLEEQLVDAADSREAARTRALLDAGGRALARALLLTAVRHPLRTAAGVALALRLGLGSDRGALRHLAYLGEAAVLLRALEREPADHVHAHFATNSTAVALLCHALGGPPYSFTAHGTTCYENAERNGLRLKLERARFAVAVSARGERELLRLAPAARVHVVHCGVEHGHLRTELAAPSGAARLVCVARLSPEKGHAQLLAACAELARAGAAFELRLIGDGDLRPALEVDAQRLGLAGRVRFLGWRSNAEVREEIVAARALVLTSLDEGLPVVVMEALALGRPVVATAVGGIPELVEDGRTGWLVPGGDVPALARALNAALAAEPARLLELGRAGRARVAERHDAAVEAGKLAQLFRTAARATPVLRGAA